MSNDYPPPGSGWEQDPSGQAKQPPPPPPEPQWNPQSAGTPPPSYGEPQPPGYGQPGYGQQNYERPGYDPQSYDPQGYDPQGYGQPAQPPAYPPPPPGAPGGYGYGQPQQTSPLAIVALVLGIVGVCCSQLFVMSIGALVAGYFARTQIQQSSGQLKGDGLALAGMIVGGIGIAIGVLYWILLLVGVVTSP